MATLMERYNIACARVDAAHNRYFDAVFSDADDVVVSVLELEFETECQNKADVWDEWVGR